MSNTKENIDWTVIGSVNMSPQKLVASQQLLDSDPFPTTPILPPPQLIMESRGGPAIALESTSALSNKIILRPIETDITSSDPISEIVSLLQDLKSELSQMREDIKQIEQVQSRMTKEIKILRFDQEAIIQSMVTDGKKISPYVEADKRDFTSLMFPQLQNNSFAHQRNLNWNLRSGKSIPFVAERTNSSKPK